VTGALTVPFTALGFGAAVIGNLYRATPDEDARAAVDAAWSAGIRYFDTAPHYGLGLSERRLGGALAERPRGEYTVSSKVGRLLVPADPPRDSDDGGFDVPGDLTRVWDFSRDGVLRSIESSLERLGVGRLDLVYVHDPDHHWKAAIEGAVPALAELRDQGVIRGFGAGMNQARMLARFVRESDMDAVMVAGRLTLLDQSALTELLPAARDRGTAVVAAGVFNSGLLSRARPTPDATFDYGPVPPELLARAHAIADVCERHGTTLPAAAVAYPLRFREVVSVVLGMRTGEQVAQNVALHAAGVPDALWDELEELGLVPPVG
jgi:D-threo-aldose 1-dehydrogenase